MCKARQEMVISHQRIFRLRWSQLDSRDIHQFEAALASRAVPATSLVMDLEFRPRFILYMTRL